MKQSTISRIVKNFENHKYTNIGNYVYSVQFNYGAWEDYIMRCKKSNFDREWLDNDGNIVNGWEFVQPVKAKEN